LGFAIVVVDIAKRVEDKDEVAKRGREERGVTCLGNGIEPCKYSGVAVPLGSLLLLTKTNLL